MISKFNSFNYIIIKDIIIDKIDELTEDGIIPKSSFDYSFYRLNLQDANSYLDILQKELQKKQINLFKFISQYEDLVFDDDDFTYKNGFMDFILYTYDNTKGLLSGEKLINREIDTYYYKYTYGFHNYEMGKKYILQSFSSLDEYFKKVSETIIQSFLDTGFGFDVSSLIEDYMIIKKHNNGYVVYGDLLSIFAKINTKFTLLNYDDFEDNFRELKKYSFIRDHILVFFVNCSVKKDNSEFEEVKDKFELIRNVNKYNL